MTAIELLTQICNQESEGLQDQVMFLGQSPHSGLFNLLLLLQPVHHVLPVLGLTLAINRRCVAFHVHDC